MIIRRWPSSLVRWARLNPEAPIGLLSAAAIAAAIMLGCAYAPRIMEHVAMGLALALVVVVWLAVNSPAPWR